MYQFLGFAKDWKSGTEERLVQNLSIVFLTLGVLVEPVIVGPIQARHRLSLL